MSHWLYHTEGLILTGWPNGETGRRFDIFTDRLGRITAQATGVRELKSKLRYHLQELTAVRISLVRGRGDWRIVYAETIQVKSFNLTERQTIARLFQLLARLIIDEGRRWPVWQEIFSAYHLISQTSLAPAELADFELLVVWRILTALGYCQASPPLTPFATAPWSQKLISDFNGHRQAALLVVEQALYHSHL